MAGPLPYRLEVSLGGTFGTEETAGSVGLRLPGGSHLIGLTEPGTQVFTGTLHGEMEIVGEVGCSPDFDGGTCTGDWSFKLEIGDAIGP